MSMGISCADTEMNIFKMRAAGPGVRGPGLSGPHFESVHFEGDTFEGGDPLPMSIPRGGSHLDSLELT